MVRSAGIDGIDGARGSLWISRLDGSPRTADGGAGWQEPPGWSTGSRTYGQQVGIAEGRTRRLDGRKGGRIVGCIDSGAERTRDTRSRMAGRSSGSPGRRRAPQPWPDVMFRLRCRSIRSEKSDSGAVRSVKGAASFSSTPKRKQRRNILSRSRVIERRRRMPSRQTVEASFTVSSAPAPRLGCAGVSHSVFPNSFLRGLTDHESRPCIRGRACLHVRRRCVVTSACRWRTSACETAARAWQRDKHVSCVGASLQSREGSRCRECSRANA